MGEENISIGDGRNRVLLSLPKIYDVTTGLYGLCQRQYTQNYDISPFVGKILNMKREDRRRKSFVAGPMERQTN